MGRLASMVSGLPGYYNKGPQPVAAFQAKHSSGAVFVVADGRLRGTATNGNALDLSLDRTLDALATAVNAVAGYTAQVVVGVTGLGVVSATTLIEDTYNGLNGDYVFMPYFTSTNWRLLSPVALAFDKVDADWTEAFSQTDLRRSDGAWLDRIGALYGIKRSPTEPDASYARRVTESVIAPKCNGYAIANIIRRALSAEATVVDTGPARFAVTLTVSDTSGNPYDTATLNTFINTYKAFGTLGLLSLQQSSAENDGIATDSLARNTTGLAAGEWGMVEFGATMFAGTILETDGAAIDSLSGKGEFGRPPFGSRRFG